MLCSRWSCRLGASAVLVHLLPSSAFASDTSTTDEISSEAPICMVRAAGADINPQTTNPPSGRAIVVVRLSVPDLEARGFVEIDCEQSGLKTSSDLANYRDEVCKLAAYGNEAVQAQLYEALGEYPAVLCANAEQVSGIWDHDTSGAP